ncbi:MAG: helix-turn-helix domain-containing protein [Spirosomaceae bacterium]|nr:helix-turn-helix domain-containing protein [Spirosomataceae bacterium]
MITSDTLLFFLSTLGWFNGLLLSAYFLFFNKQKSLSYALFGALLLVLSIRISKSVIWYFKPDLPVFFIQLGLAVCFFIGPLLFFYLKSSLEQTPKMPMWWQVTLNGCVAFVLVLLVFFTASSQLVLWKKYFVKLIYGQWLLCVLGSGFLLKPIILNLLSSTKTTPLKPHDKWLLGVYLSHLMIVVSYVLSYFNVLNIAYITGAVTFTLLLYLNVLILLYRKKTDDLFSPAPEKYNQKKIQDTEAKALISRLEKVLTQQEVYKNPDLKLSDLAAMLDLSTHQLSQLLNDNLQKSFSTYLNEYRIQKACELIAADTDLKVEGIGYEVGYNAKSTFFAAFKKVTGQTPSQYKEVFCPKL